MAATLDNIKFFDAKLPNPTGPGELQFSNTHLRGFHRLKQEGPATLEHISDLESILTVTLTPKALEFHSEAVYSFIGRPILGMRSFATVDNLNLHLKVCFNYSIDTGIPVQLLELYIDPNPKFSVQVETLKSEWGEGTTGNTDIKANVEDFLNTTHIPQLLRDLFSQKTIFDVNQAFEETFRKQNTNSEVGPTWIYDKLAFIWFWSYRHEMCQTYRLSVNHTLEFEQSGITSSITVNNGVIRGLDYIRRTECADLVSCVYVPCPTGYFIFDYDDIYIDYDIVADIKGRSSQGKMTVTISGLQEKDDHGCVTYCDEVWWTCDTIPVRHGVSFPKLGKVLVDVEGLPDEWQSHHEDLVELTRTTRAKLLQQISAGVYGDSHLDNKQCMIR